MSLLVQVLFWIATVGSVTSTIYCLMVVAAAIRFGARKQRDDRAAEVSQFLPSGERAEAAARNGRWPGAQSRNLLPAGLSGV